MHLICRIGVPLTEMPCARQLNRKKTRSGREPIARTKAMYLAIVMLGLIPPKCLLPVTVWRVL
jgi:hypothetical protein